VKSDRTFVTCWKWWSGTVRRADGRKTLKTHGHNEVRYTRYYSHRMGLSVLLYPAVHDYFVATMFSLGVRVSRSVSTSRFHDPKFLLNQNQKCSRHKSNVNSARPVKSDTFLPLRLALCCLLPLCESVFRTHNMNIRKLLPWKVGVYIILVIWPLIEFYCLLHTCM
jgi:hypothetical protein